MKNSEWEARLIAKLETSQTIVQSTLPLARSIVRYLAPFIGDINRQDLAEQRRKLERKRLGVDAEV